MANENNLTPFNEMPPERQREIARKGGIASGAARRAKRKGNWILSKDKKPEIPCLYCDGHKTNGVRLCTSIVSCTKKETGETMYFSGDLFDMKWGLMVDPCVENSIIAWMPLPERYGGADNGNQ